MNSFGKLSIIFFCSSLSQISILRLMAPPAFVSSGWTDLELISGLICSSLQTPRVGHLRLVVKYICRIGTRCVRAKIQCRARDERSKLCFNSDVRNERVERIPGGSLPRRFWQRTSQTLHHRERHEQKAKQKKNEAHELPTPPNASFIPPPLSPCNLGSIAKASVTSKISNFYGQANWIIQPHPTGWKAMQQLCTHKRCYYKSAFRSLPPPEILLLQLNRVLDWSGKEMVLTGYRPADAAGGAKRKRRGWGHWPRGGGRVTVRV